MYHLVNKPDGSFQILDDEGENYGIYGDRDEAQEALDALNKTKKAPKTEAKVEEPTKPKITYPGAKVFKKAFSQPTKKSPVVKKSPIKRGRPKKVR